MTQKQTIVWTALPYGIRNGKAWLSVLVSPRLDGNANQFLLSDFTDFVNWPMTVQGIEFSAEVDGGPTQIALTPQYQLDFDLWERIFTPGVVVYRHQFTDLKYHKLRSYPVRNTLQYLQNKYQGWVNLGPGIPPRFETLEGTPIFNDLINMMPLPSRKNREIELEYQLGAQKALTASSNPAYNFYQVHKFYNPDLPSDSEHRPEIPEFDFHEGVALLADHPSLMRALGLVLDFSMELPPGPTGAIRVIPSWASEIEKHDIMPFTHYWQSGTEFQAHWEAGGDLREGFLDLSNVGDLFAGNQKNYDLVQVDPDGSLLKMMHFSYAMQGLTGKHYPLGMEQETGLPGLRTGGLGLVHLNRADNLHQHLLKMSAINVDYETDPTARQYFYLDELLRGYRVDMKDLSIDQPPLSLCWRIGQYLINNGDNFKLAPEEGYIKSASATSQTEVPDELYLHEMLFRWNGWSLCAERPHKTIVPASIPDHDPGTGKYENVKRIQSKPEGRIDLTPVLEALPGSLPRLRFGHDYQVRVRAVDVAGNSLPEDHPDWDKASDRITYKRYEPVPSPALVLRDSLSTGEAIERMVIRSNYDKPVVSDSQRHIVPPKTSQEMAETHGEFDKFIGLVGDHQQGYYLALKEAGTLNDTEIIDTNTGLKVPLDEADKIRFDKITTDDGVETELVIHGEEKLILPYLPDPMSVGTTINGIPRLDDDWLPELEKIIVDDLGINVVKVPFEMNWPDARCFRLHLAERKGVMEGTSCGESFADDETQKAQWDADARVLSIFLAKAEKVTLRYSSYLRLGNEDLFAVWDWLKNKKYLEIYLHAGCLWMITPHRKLELVHAVQQPLCDPELRPDVSAKKTKMGQTQVNITGNARLNAWSTEKIDLFAKWDEWDDTDREGPKLITDQKAHACEGLIPYSINNMRNLNADPHNLTHEFGDTRHRWVNYHLVATSRFREYFQPEGGLPIDFTRVGPVKRVNIENSARPAAPKIQYIVPSFGWKRSKQGNTITSIRLGGGVRVYLERPWFSSGDDELLGVILPHAPVSPTQAIPDHLQPYVTQCGLDPIWKTANPERTTNLSYTDFRGYSEHGENLTLEELVGVTFPKKVDVVGYAPEFNSDRKLWFCDIQFNPERLFSYYPFVRLGLARFQPYSIPDSDAFLSRVEMSDFIQLVPTRSLQVVRSIITSNIQKQIKTQFSLTLTGYAPKYSVGAVVYDPNQTNPVSVTIEEHDDTIPGDLGWKPIPSTTLQPNPLFIAGTQVSHSPFLWTWQGTIKLEVSAINSAKYRLVVKEFERFTPDGHYESVTNDEPLIPGNPALRVVYTDIVDLKEFLDQS
jgi:hypothetical protein